MNLICGINPVLEALSAGTRHFDRLLIVKGLRNRRVSEAIRRASEMGVPLRFEARETLDRMAGGVPHQGVIAVVSAKPVSRLEELVEAARDPALFILLDGVLDPRNLGAILRTAEAAGADGVLLPDRHSAGLSETVARASAGALEHVRVARVGNVVQALTSLKARGVWVVGFEAAGTERWDAVDYRRPVALVLGGEDRGIRRLVREHCDHLVSLPLFGHISSLNVSVASGIALYEVIRQRGSVPSHVKPIPVRPLPTRAQIVGPGPEDREHDPGAAPVDDVAGGEEHEAEPLPGLVQIQEETAWSGPTMLRPVGFGHGQGRTGGRFGRRQADRPEAAARSGAPAPVPVPLGDPGGGRRRRRRRRRGRGPGGQPPPSGGASVLGGAAPPPEAAPGQRRHRRRRRR